MFLKFVWKNRFNIPFSILINESNLAFSSLSVSSVWLCFHWSINMKICLAFSSTSNKLLKLDIELASLWYWWYWSSICLKVVLNPKTPFILLVIDCLSASVVNLISDAFLVSEKRFLISSIDCLFLSSFFVFPLRRLNPDFNFPKKLLLFFGLGCLLSHVSQALTILGFSSSFKVSSSVSSYSLIRFWSVPKLVSFPKNELTLAYSPFVPDNTKVSGFISTCADESWSLLSSSSELSSDAPPLLWFSLAFSSESNSACSCSFSSKSFSTFWIVFWVNDFEEIGVSYVFSSSKFKAFDPIMSASVSNDVSSFIGIFSFFWTVGLTLPSFCWTTCQASCGKCFSCPFPRWISVPWA